jgi:hypothetical protein
MCLKQLFSGAYPSISLGELDHSRKRIGRSHIGTDTYAYI